MSTEPIASGEGRGFGGMAAILIISACKTLLLEMTAAESSVLWYFILLSGSPCWGTVEGSRRCAAWSLRVPPFEDNLAFSTTLLT